MNKRWFLVLLSLLFAIVAGALFVFSVLNDSSARPGAKDFKDCVAKGGQVSSGIAPTYCSYLGQNYTDGDM